MTGRDLKRHAISGAALLVGGRFLRAVQSIAALAILSRYLTPVEFGLIAMVVFVSAIAQIFTDFGTRVALVQRQAVTRLEENSVFWWNLGVGAVLTVLIMVFSAPIARLMGEVQMQVPLMWVAPIFLIGALQGVSLSVLERKLAFGKITLAEVGAAVAGSVAAIVMVIQGFKIEALVAQQVVAAVLNAALVLGFARWRPGLAFSFAALKPLLAYGSYVTAAGVVQTLSSQADRPVVGNRLSAADLGFLAISEQIVLSPLRIMVQMVRRVMFPIMSSVQDDDARMRRGYIGMQHGLMVIMAPVAFGLWAVAEPLVAVLLGKGWEMVAVLMGYLTLRSLFTTFSDLNYVVLSAKGWARFQFRWSIFSALVTIATLLATVGYGIEAVVAGRLAVSAVLAPLFASFALRLIKQPAIEVVVVLIRPLVAAGLMGLTVAWGQGQLAQAGYGALLQLGMCIPAGALIYLAGEMLLDRARIVPLIRQIRSRERK